MVQHGLRNHPVYLLYRRIRNKCYLTSYRNYHRYGGRGIRISDEFFDIEVFKKYLETLDDYQKWLSHYDFSRGKNPLTLDRINNDKGYQRGNLRFTTQRVQIQNRDITKNRGFPQGVFLHQPSVNKGYKKIFRARVYVNGKRIELGYHETIELAGLVVRKFLGD